MIAVTVEELRQEIDTLEDLITRAHRLVESGRESKFEKLREVLEDPRHEGQRAGQPTGSPRRGSASREATAAGKPCADESPSGNVPLISGRAR